MIPWHQYLIGVVFILAGVNHLRKPKIYKAIIPPYLPSPSSLVIASGIAEMILGFMILNPETQSIAAWGIIIMLLCYFPIHIYMLQNEKASLKLPKWLLIVRIPLQFALIYWAYLYT